MQIKDVIDFCEQKLSPKEFMEELMKPESEELFYDAPSIPPYTKAKGMLYYYLIEQNYDDIGKLVNVQSCLVKFLEAKGVDVHPTTGYLQLHSMLISAQPSWLRVSSEYLSNLLKDKKSLSVKEQKEYLKEELKRQFQYTKKPPKWLQSPNWPIIDGVPLLFLGQLDVSELYHDSAQLYVFFDKRNEAFHHVVQRM